MKIRTTVMWVAILCAALATSAMAQTPDPAAEAQFQQILRTQPELRANPSLFANQTWLGQHPGIAEFLTLHPLVHEQAARMAHGEYGAFDQNHQWRDANWWHQQNPNWVAQNHPEWGKNHPEWGKIAAAERRHHEKEHHDKDHHDYDHGEHHDYGHDHDHE